MMSAARNTLFDGFRTLAGGIDSGRPPDNILADQVSFAINATFRGGHAMTRPGLRRRQLRFLDSEGVEDETLQAAFESGLYQRASYMRVFGYDGILVAQIGGRTYRIDVLRNFLVTDLTLHASVETTAAFTIPNVFPDPGLDEVGVGVNDVGDLVVGDTLTFVVSGVTSTYTLIAISGLNLTLRNLTGTPTNVVPRGTLVQRGTVAVEFEDTNSSTLPRAWLEQAEDFLVIQDGQSKPLVYDGSVLRRADSEGLAGALIAGTTDRHVREVPVGTIMAYSNGRLWVTLNDGHSFVASDLTGGPTGTLQYNHRDAVLKFSENDIIAEGGSFGVPVSAGPITAMCPLANLDTSLGQGPLQVFTATCTFGVNAPFDRTTWKDLQYPIQTVSALAYGALSHEATINVNSDIWYRSGDGVRSFQIAHRDFDTVWATTPLSREMNRILEADDRHQLSYASAVVFDNRLLMTCSPQRVASHGVTHRGIAALDFDRASALLQRLAPVWEGAWTGLQVLQVVAGRFANVDRCFLFTLSTDNAIQLWELSRDDPFDTSDLDSTDRRIVSLYETRSFTFKDEAWGLKELVTGITWVDDVVGSVEFAVSYRPDQHPCWQSWHTWTANAAYKDCSTDPLVCHDGPTTYVAQYRPFVRLPEPGLGCDPITDKPYRQGYEFQARFVVTGHARIKRFLVVARAMQDETLGACPP